MKTIFALLASILLPLSSFAENYQNPDYIYGDATTAPGYMVYRARDHYRAPSLIQSGDVINGLFGRGYNSTSFTSVNNVAIEFQAAENWTTTANGTKILFKATPTSGTTPATVLTISGDGGAAFAAAATSQDAFTVSAVATNDDPTTRVQFARIATTTGTAADIWTMDLDADTTYLFEANVVGRRTGGTAGSVGDSAAYKVFGSIVDISGTATAVGAGTSTAITLEDQAGWTAAFTVSAGNVILQVTGALDNNVVWHAEIKYMKVAS